LTRSETRARRPTARARGDPRDFFHAFELDRADVGGDRLIDFGVGLATPLIGSAGIAATRELEPLTASALATFGHGALRCCPQCWL
jgi:hypothetical protein